MFLQNPFLLKYYQISASNSDISLKKEVLLKKIFTIKYIVTSNELEAWLNNLNNLFIFLTKMEIQTLNDG